MCKIISNNFLLLQIGLFLIILRHSSLLRNNVQCTYEYKNCKFGEDTHPFVHNARKRMYTSTLHRLVYIINNGIISEYPNKTI